MTAWEIEQVRETMKEAEQRKLMPTITRMLGALMDERAVLLDVAKRIRQWEHLDYSPEGVRTVDSQYWKRSLDKAIDKAES